MNTHKITIDESSKVKPLTFLELRENMEDEIQNYASRNQTQELLQQPIILNLLDAKGVVVQGQATDMIGWLEGGGVLITGNINQVAFSQQEGLSPLLEEVEQELEDLSDHGDISPYSYRLFKRFVEEVKNKL